MATTALQFPLDHRGEGLAGVYHLEPVEQADAPKNFPRKLSPTGLFAAVANHEVADGLKSLTAGLGSFQNTPSSSNRSRWR